MRENIHSRGGKLHIGGPVSSSSNSELRHTSDMNAEQLACKVVADHVLSIADPVERRAFARHLIAYSIGSLVAMDGDQTAAEFVYRAADATVGVS